MDVCLAISQNLQAFLRISILNFQVHNKQPANLNEIKTQVELKEKHRAIEDHVESKISQIIEWVLFEKGFRTSANQVSYV